MKLSALLKQPSGFLPITMSLAAIVEVILYVVLFGITRQEDEGIAARIFQLLLVAQLPVMLYFAVNWLQQFPRQVLLVLALQLSAMLAPILLILFLEAY